MTNHNNIRKNGRYQYEHDWFYRSKAWERIREIALDRDNYLCQMCLEHGEITDAKIVHHIVYVDHDFSKALEIDNLMSVCQKCHNQIHAKDTNYKKENSLKVRVLKM
ncbi:HNH endonuclease [Staphylococcus muscae]|uniref:Putative HNH nuclease YajD n=1 Tax=Staphylococcus muscae TaxID=1294 RepID=A0A240BY24_9STAP|nr:HNH endonuclease signature motif containing protein [Staphylococcus muscae]AVQ34413.1 HNH endonuclease [Staphylococcus muscae]PNZ03554.1 HNH endonuclease [Staphylococcus muscae]GGA93287.1 HNH endonuclease [Staphylococcus muscae]SNW00687.1 HNH endonuclease family protein [Staphylococcus muscae]